MTDFTPTPEAVEAVAKAFYEQHRAEWPDYKMPPVDEAAPFDWENWKGKASAAIAAFVEAEGLTMERAWRYSDGSHSAGPDLEAEKAGAPVDERLVGPWRKRD